MADVLARLAAALADRYSLERELGAGGMATVYLAHDIKHDRKVAIKVLRPELAAVIGAERFLSEIKTTAALQHPHILPLFDSGTVEVESRDSGPRTHLFYVMPYVTGESLRDRLDRETQLPIADAVQIATEVAGALDYAHRHGVIHRDIKPENILLHDGSALVADFGIALAASTAGSRMTETGMSLGTPHYMSPEQALGEREITARSDVYALGCVTFEMLTGEPPFTGPTAQAIVAKVMTAEPAGVTSLRKTVPRHVADAVHVALQKLPADRFESAKLFADALANPGFTTQIGGTARTPGMPSRRSNRLLGAATGVAVLAMLAAAWGWLRPRPAPAVVRYRIALGTVPSIRDWTGELAISPDGQVLVHTGGPNGALLVRHRDELGFMPMPATERAQGPFFSPDGSTVGFFSAGRLMVADLAGGPARVLDDSVSRPEAMTWSADGSIYRMWDAGGGLLSIGRMEARPGAPILPFTRVDTAAGEVAHLLPEALPNGKAILIQIQYGDGKRMIATARIPDGRVTLLVEGTRARYARNGQLLYATADGKLWSVPFDQDALTIAGTPELVSGALPSTMVGPVDFDVSASGTLAYAVDDASESSELVWVTRNGRSEPVDTSWDAAFSSPALSPDGTFLAVALSHESTSDIWIKRLAGGPAVKLSIGNQTNDEPAWTADSKSVSYIAGAPGTGSVGDVWVRPIAGGANATLVLDDDRPISEQRWSPTGEWLVVRTTTPAAGAGDILGVRPSIGGAAVPIVATSRIEYSPTVSLDGRWMAYVSNESGRLEVYVVPFPNPGTAKWQISNQGGSAPQWSPHGNEVFFLDLQSHLVAAQVTTSPTFALLGQHTLFDASGYLRQSVSRRNYDVTGDGQRFLMIQRAGNAAGSQVVVVENWSEALKQRTGP
ncbi:MAG TPA: protein kinase [Gemmatimonadales bacterium]|nr:protein kinase [Gemmatimonadales bacterium]